MTLVDAASNETVTEAMLAPFSVYLSTQLAIKVDCLLISAARTDAEQISILSKLAQVLTDKEQVVIDITHSFRHLPLIAMVAARFLKVTKQIDVQQIYYGNFIPGSEVHPVLELKGLLTMLDWVDALSTFDKDGDYFQFASLLTKQGLAESTAEQLTQAAFFEHINNSSQARQKLVTISQQLEQLDTPIYNLFKPQLINRLNWFRKQGIHF